MRREGKRPVRSFTLFTAVLWTLITAAWIAETVHRHGLYGRGYMERGNVYAAGALALVNAALALCWWYNRLRYDKEDGSSDDPKNDE
nr:hypothetical protein [uncultured Oscillibacter sp.]